MCKKIVFLIKEYKEFFIIEKYRISKMKNDKKHGKQIF